MKYLLLGIFSIFSICAMQKPSATKKETRSPDEQVLHLQEQVQAIKNRQIAVIAQVATVMNESFEPELPEQSMLITAEQIKRMTPEAFAASVTEGIKKKLEANITNSMEALRRLSECHTTLVDAKKRKEKNKKLNQTEELSELSSYIQTKHAAEEAFKKIAELQYYLDIYYSQEQNKPTKPLMQQED